MPFQLDANIYDRIQQPQPFNGLAMLGQVRQQQQQEQLAQQQLASGHALEDERRQKVRAEGQRLAGVDALNKIGTEAMVQDPTSGIWTFDRQKFQEGAIKSGHLDQLPALAQHLDAMDETTKKRAAEGRTLTAKGLLAIKDAGFSPQAALGTAAYMHKNGLLSEANAGQFVDAITADPSPANVEALTMKIAQGIPEYRDLLQAEETRKGATAKTTADTAKTVRETELLGQLTPAQAATNAATLSGQVETARHNRATEHQAAAAASGADSAVSLTPEALTLTAKQFAMTGQLPPMGMGKQGAAVRTKIINEAAKTYAGLDLPSQVAAYKASKDSLVKLQGQRDAMGAFEETALKNLGVFMETAGKVVDTGSPLINRSLRSLSGGLMGSPEMTAYNTARRTVIPEFAKILANPGLSGQLSDSARKEIEEVVSGDATLKQTLAAAKILTTDAANRRTSYDDQIKAIQERIARPPGSPAAAPAAAAGITVTTPSGKPYTFKTQADADAAVAKAKAAGLWK